MRKDNEVRERKNTREQIYENKLRGTDEKYFKKQEKEHTIKPSQRRIGAVLLYNQRRSQVWLVHNQSHTRVDRITWRIRGSVVKLTLDVLNNIFGNSVVCIIIIYRWCALERRMSTCAQQRRYEIYLLPPWTPRQVLYEPLRYELLFPMPAERANVRNILCVWHV